MDNLIYQWALV